MRGRWILVLGLVAHLLLQAGPAFVKVTDPHAQGRDFASYYYALQVAAHGGDPYENASLDAAAQADHTRRSVNPFFYPPPFLLGVGWALPLSLRQAYVGMLALNEALLGGTLYLLATAWGVPLWAIALVLGTYSPIPDNAWMGQANLMALLPALAGLTIARRRPWLGGVLVGIAGMVKMSPALFLLYWAIRREWRPIVAAAVTAVALSVATLPLVGVAAQLRFYTEVLPGFPSGDYHGLTVPISLPANHSIPDLYDRLWGGPTKFKLSAAAQHASSLTTLVLLAVWAWACRKRGNELAAIGALTVLMVVTPVYTYEHHLVFLLPAVAAAATGSPAFFLVYFFLAWPLDWLRWVQAHLPSAVGPLIRESKTLAEAGLFVLCLVRQRQK